MRQMSFITDFGERLSLLNDKGDIVTEIPRYGAWEYDPNKGKHQVVTVSDDLESLQLLYNVPESGIFKTTSFGKEHI